MAANGNGVVTPNDARAAEGLPTVVVKREPVTYERNGPNSYFHDMLRAEALQDETAQSRLDRHRIEMRALTSVDGSGGEFAPPAWMVGLTGPAIAGGRVIADLIDHVGNLYPLPRGVNQVNVPIISVGAGTGVQAGEGQPGTAVDPTTSSAAANVITVSGQVVASQQVYDQAPPPGFDQIMLTDLTANYDQALEKQLVTGTGANGQVLGLLNVTNAVKVAAGVTIVPAALAGATNMITGVWLVLGSMLAQIGNGRQQAARHFVMAPRRWAAIASSLDQQSRPVSVPGSDAPQAPGWPDMGAGATGRRGLGSAPVGPIMGCPVWQSATLGPVSNASGALGAGGTDTILAIRPRDLLLWESEAPGFAVTTQLAGTLQVQVQLRKYVAFASNRYPSGIAAATGLIQPTSGLTGWTF